MAGQACARWLVCSGALEFAGLASALVLGACATSIQWAPTSHDIRDILQFLHTTRIWVCLWPLAW